MLKRFLLCEKPSIHLWNGHGLKIIKNSSLFLLFIEIPPIQKMILIIQ